jgi:hypothetical protein
VSLLSNYVFIQLMILSGLALSLYHAAISSDIASPRIFLPYLGGNGGKHQTRLDTFTCPSGLRPIFDHWTGLVPRIKSLSQEHLLGLAFVLCKKTPITLPAELPDPFPCAPTAGQKCRDPPSLLSVTIPYVVATLIVSL